MIKKITQNYYKSLPRKRMASGVIIRNKNGDILILKTNYKDHWEIPGGIVEKNESPKQTAERETMEEIGIKITASSCLVIHYRSAQSKQDENIMFVFDGGIIKDTQNLHLNKKEIIEAKFLSFKEATKLVGNRIASRLPFCEKALKEKQTIYLESIGQIEPTFIS